MPLGDEIREDGIAKRGLHEEEEEEFVRVLVGQPEGTKSAGTLRRRYECNIKLDRKEIGWEVMDWNHLAQGRYKWCARVNVVMYLRVQ